MIASGGSGDGIGGEALAEDEGESGGDGRRSRRRLIWGVVIADLALLLLIAAVAVVSWNYSNDVLVPDHSDDPYEIEVVAVGSDTVELEATEGTARPGAYGLEWPQGSAIIGPVVEGGEPGDDEGARDEVDEGEGETVTRELIETQGELTPGTEVRLDTYTFQGDPLTARGLPFREVEVEGELGPMPAWQIGPSRNRRWAVVVHGINGSRRVALPIAPTLRRAGLTALVITYRDDPEAPASPDGYHHMGLTEWRDLEAGVRYALDQGARDIVLIGHSMGGAIVTQFVERSPLAEHARAMILDAPALDWPATIAFGARQLGLPSFASLPVKWMVGLRIDADWDQLDALAHTDELTLPTLLFHGEEDDLVPIETSDEFAAALPDTVTYYRTPYADHVQSWNVNPRLYERRVSRFLAQVAPARGEVKAKRRAAAAA